MIAIKTYFLKHPLASLGLSGILCAIAFTFPQCALLMWVALVPFFLALTRHKPSWRRGFLFGMVYYTLLLSWMLVLYPLDWLGVTGWQGMILMLMMWLGIAAYEAAGLGVVIWLWGKMRFHRGYDVITLAALWILLEYSQGIGMLGFTWGRLGISQYPNPLLIQAASLFGSLLITFLIIVVNGLIANTLLYFKESKHWLTTLSVVIIGIIGFGAYQLSTPHPASGTLKTSIVQGNISSNDKWATDSLKTIINTYLDLSDQALADQPQLLVWPETAVPVDITQSPDTLAIYQQLAKKGQVYFMFGGFETVDQQQYNAISIIDPNGQLVNPSYYKQHLVPFGEYVPFKQVVMSLIPKLAEINRLDTDLTAGDGSHLLQLANGKIGSLICFESIFPNLARQSVQDGADILFIATNDSWYQQSAAITQHNGQAIFRAVENHRAIIRAANTGTSVFIDPQGYVIAGLPELAADHITATLPMHQQTTLYNRVGDVIIVMALAYLLIIAARKRRI